MIEPIGAKWVAAGPFTQTFGFTFTLVEDATGKTVGNVMRRSPFFWPELWSWSIGETTGKNETLGEAAEAATKAWNASRTEVAE